MTTSQKSFLSDVLNADQIPIGKLAYFRGRLTNRIHALVLDEFAGLSEAGKINKAQLAKRIGCEPAQVTRWLGSPGNWTIKTFSDLLLAMGYEPSISVRSLGDVSQQEAAFDTHNNVYLLPIPAGNSLTALTLSSIGSRAGDNLRVGCG